MWQNTVASFHLTRALILTVGRDFLVDLTARPFHTV
jgi:hypothetical protein